MIRLLLLLILFFLAYTIYHAVTRYLTGGAGKSIPPEKTPKGEEMVLDSHCGTYLPRGDALEKRIGGQIHFFCSPECRDAFSRK